MVRSQSDSCAISANSATSPECRPRDAEQWRIAALIATRNRTGLLRERALESITRQSLAPDCVVIVNDGAPWTARVKRSIRESCSVKAVCLDNRNSPGAAGAWNTGLDAIQTLEPRGFVAILDDDDTWDPDHLRLNATAAQDSDCNIVVSGLRICTASGSLNRPLISTLRDRDFLVGNPGWQGSNTFVSLPLLLDAGGFCESLPSMHDRDLAIRLLRHPLARACLVQRWTASWYMDTPENLTSFGSVMKREALRIFFMAYGHEMTADEQRMYFERAETLFGFSEADIVCGDRTGSATPIVEYGGNRDQA